MWLHCSDCNYTVLLFLEAPTLLCLHPGSHLREMASEGNSLSTPVGRITGSRSSVHSTLLSCPPPVRGTLRDELPAGTVFCSGFSSGTERGLDTCDILFLMNKKVNEFGSELQGRDNLPSLAHAPDLVHTRLTSAPLCSSSLTRPTPSLLNGALSQK